MGEMTVSPEKSERIICGQYGERFVANACELICTGVRHLNEKNSCVVFALSHFLGKTYDETHELCKQVFDRKPQRGVSGHYFCYDFEIGGQTLKRMQVKTIGKNARISVKKFCDLNPVGKFLLTTRSHCLCVIDGVVYDNNVNGSIWKFVQTVHS